MPTLVEKVREVLDEVNSPTNPAIGDGVRLISIDREIDRDRLARGEVVVLSCDIRKIFALIAAISSRGTERVPWSG